MKTDELRIRLDERVRAAEIIHKHVMDNKTGYYLDEVEKIQRDVMNLSDLSPETTPGYDVPENVNQTVVKFNPADYDNQGNDMKL